MTLYWYVIEFSLKSVHTAKSVSEVDQGRDFFPINEYLKQEFEVLTFFSLWARWPLTGAEVSKNVLSTVHLNPPKMDVSILE